MLLDGGGAVGVLVLLALALGAVRVDAADGGVDAAASSSGGTGAVFVARPVLPAVPPPSRPLLEANVTADTDLVLLPSSRRPPPRPAVTSVTRVAAATPTVLALLLSPLAWRQALPSLISAEVTTTRPGPRADAWPDRLLAWEVEIPLFNLRGHAWLKQQPGGADLELVDGAFAPGAIALRATPTLDGRATLLICQMRIDVQSSNWILRRVARHDPWAETAMSAAMAWVLTRALGLRAETAPGATPARPHDAIHPPPAGVLDTAFLAAPSLASLRATGVLAAVRRAGNGRLAWAGVAVPVTGSPAGVASRLAAPETWGVFPGWKSVKRRPAKNGFTNVSVEDNVALVDLDAVWSLDSRLPGRATVIDGATRNAVLAWQVATGDGPGSSLAVLSMHPHLDAAGLIERKFIAAEPLLEHALALALAYVDAAAIADVKAPPAAAPPAGP